MEEEDGCPLGIAAFLIIQVMKFRNLELTGVVGFNGGVEFK
jgi:hypothetical protein